MPSLRETRDIELSIIYYVETNINADWSGVTTVKSFTNAYKAALPVVCIRLTDTTNTRREVGATTLLNNYTISIDIFANSDGQRLDLADYIVDKLKDGCVFYNHAQSSGNPETLSRVADGRITITNFLSNQALDLGDDVDKYDRHRHFLSFSVRKNE